MKCPRCQTVNPHQAKFCLQCGLSLTQRCGNCNSTLYPDSRFCVHCGHPVIEITPADDIRLSRLASAAPRSLVQKIRASDNFTGERRMVTFLFIDVVDSTTIKEQVSVDIWTDMMNNFVDQIIPIIYLYEGTVARVLGDSILVFFGAPIAHEDDPARAVRSALEILPVGDLFTKRIQNEHSVEFLIRACIHTGFVVINSVMDGMKYDFSSSEGDINLTSRIKFAASPRSIILTEKTYRFITPIFSCTQLEPITVKGHVKPVQIYKVDGIKSQPEPLRGVYGLVSKMVGRDMELNALSNLCEAVRVGLGRAVIIHGEPGIGKTRLVSEWKTVVDSEILETPPIWAEGRGQSFSQGQPYHMLTSLVRSVLGIPQNCNESKAINLINDRTQELFGDSGMEVYPYIAHLLSCEVEVNDELSFSLQDPQVLQTQYYRAIEKLFNAISSNQPLVCILEDLHWADSSSVDILMRLLPLVSTESILMCLILRDERDTPGWKLVSAAREILGGSLIEVSLSPLSETDSGEIISNLLEIDDIPDMVRSTILKKAEGNPFFVEEVIRMLIDHDVIIRDEDRWIVRDEFNDVEIPDNLQGLLLARIDRLPEQVKNVLRVASVIGRKFPIKVLQEVFSERI